MDPIRDLVQRARQTVGDLLRGAADGLSRPPGEPFAPFEHGGLTVHCHSAWPSDERLLRQWDAISREMPAATPFHSPVWQAANFRSSGAHTLRLITVHRGEDLLAVLPTQLSDAGGLGTIGFWMTDYLDPLVQGPDAWRAILAFLARHWDRKINEVVLHNVRTAASLREIVPLIAADTGFSYDEVAFDAAPALDLPASWDEFLARLDSHERKELRRKIRNAETKAGAARTRVIEPTEVARTLALALDFMERAGGEKAESVRRYVRPLLEEAAPPLIADGRMELHVLSLLGPPVCCLFQFAVPGGVMLYNIGYDPSLSEWSPGVVAVGMAIRDAIARGAKTYDLLRGREPYKYRLGAVDRPLYRITLRRK